MTSRLGAFFDSRTKTDAAIRALGRKVFPDHWSFLLGEVALYSFLVLLMSGTFLMFFFDASMESVDYAGPYVPLKGLEMSAAMASTLDLSFSVRGGLLMRQTHHWAALLFNAAIALHLLRIFFTGAFRKPRELNWLIGFILFVLAIAEGFTGYSLPDDTLSGNGLRIADGVAKSIPVIGTYASFLLFGGDFPGEAIIGRLYGLHVLLIPALILLLVTMHIVLVVVHKHTQYPAGGRTERNVVGYPMLPVYAAKAGGFFFIVFGVIVLIASFVGINSIWLYGPFDPSLVSAGTQPDWYIGFIDGILRLVPSGWETEILGYTFSWNMIIPVMVLTAFLVLIAIYPFVERWVLGDDREHHVLQRPRNAPVRTGLGAAGIVFYCVLWSAASSDVLATHFQLSIEGVLITQRVLLFAGPLIGFELTRRLCLGLQEKDRSILLHGRESGRIVRMPGGEYVEVHDDVDDYEQWRLIHHDPGSSDVEPHGPRLARLRQRIAQLFFEDRIAPLDLSEADRPTQ